MYLYFNVHLFNNPQILLCSHCILCMISFSASYIYKYYLETNPYIHRSPPVAHTHWCVKRTKSAPTNAHQKRTYRCAPKAHLQMRTKSAPTGAHQKRTCRWPVGAHQKRTYPSFTYLHPHLLRAHLQVRTKSTPTGAHQMCTYRCAPTPHLHICTRTKSAPTTVSMYEQFRWQRTKHAPIWATQRTYLLQGQWVNSLCAGYFFF